MADSPNLDASLKKNTSFVKRLRVVTPELLEGLKADFEGLRLIKYLSECATAILENKFKNAKEISAAVEMCSLILSKYYTFSGLLFEQLSKMFDRTKDILLQKKYLSFLTELVISGFFENDTEILLRILAIYFTTRSVTAVSQFKQLDVELTSLCVHFVENHMPTLMQPEVFGKEFTCRFETFFKRYYECLCIVLQKSQKTYLAIGESNKSYTFTKGELSVEQREKESKCAKIFSTLFAAVTCLSESFGFEFPRLEKIPDANESAGLITISPNIEESIGNFGYFESKEELEFYTISFNIKEMVPAKILGNESTYKPAVSFSFDQVEERDPDQVSKSPNTKDADLFLDMLPRMIASETADKTAIEFCYNYRKIKMNNLVEAILSIPKGRLELVPFYCRFVAVLSEHFSDLVSLLKDTLIGRFTFCFHKKTLFLPKRQQISIFISELTKFGVFTPDIAIVCITKLVGAFEEYNIEACADFIMHCGRYLSSNPISSNHFERLLEIVLKKMSNQIIDSKRSMMILSAYNQCVSKTTAHVRRVKEKTELFIVHLLTTINDTNVEDICMLFRKIDWTKEWEHLLHHFSRSHKMSHLQMQNIGKLLWILSETSDFYRNFISELLDRVFINIEGELDSEMHKFHNMSNMMFIASLFDNNLISRVSVIFLLSTLISRSSSYENWKMRVLMTSRLLMQTEILNSDDSHMVEFRTFFVLFLKRYPLTSDLQSVIGDLSFDILSSVMTKVSKDVVHDLGNGISRLGLVDTDTECKVYANKSLTKDINEIDLSQSDYDEFYNSRFEFEFSKLIEQSFESRKYEKRPMFDEAIPHYSEDLGENSFKLLSRTRNTKHVRIVSIQSDNHSVLSAAEIETRREDQQRMKEITLGLVKK